MMELPANFYAGTSGLVLPVSKAFYPPAFQGKSRLEYYASLFDSIEINSSFYKLPQVSTVEKWVASVNNNFHFTFKLSKAITHVKGCDFNDDDVKQFMMATKSVSHKKGCLLIQFPPGLKIDAFENVERLLQRINELQPATAWKVVVEFRHATWYTSEVYAMLTQHNAALVLHDLPASAPPIDASTADFMYLRFHGPGGRYRGSYSTEFLQAHAQKIQRWLKEHKTVYAYFNNTMGDAVKNLQALNEMVNR
jgi:uncharacterized protein YecE (DUF72 family)